MVQPCDFPDEDMALLGQILRGMRDKEVKKVLLGKPAPDLTLTVAAREIIAAESATQHVSIVGSSTVATGSGAGTLYVGHDKPIDPVTTSQSEAEWGETSPAAAVLANSIDGSARSYILTTDSYSRLVKDCFISSSSHSAAAATGAGGSIWRLPLLVVQEHGPCLLGRVWFEALDMHVVNIPQTISHVSAELPKQLSDFSELFQPSIGLYNGPPVHIHLTEGAKPVFMRPRPVPFALEAAVSKELEKLQADGVLVPTTISEWATPTVNIKKSDGNIRICGDYSATVNLNCARDIHPLPSIEEILSKLNGGKFFARLDMPLAFLQIPVDKETSKILTLTTHKGLFRADCDWKWTAEHDECITHVKDILSTAALTHYSTELPLLLACDASPYGVGAVISHIMPNGEERPIAFGSKTLKSAEQNYSHVDKEALAVVFGVRKFYPYLAGRSFTIITDSKPVVGIFNPTKSISENLSPRMLRWRLYLNNFDFVIEHKKGMLHTNADFLSRMPTETGETESLFPEPAGVLLLEEAPASSLLNAESIAVESKRDPIISKVIDGLIHGRDYSSLDPNLTNYVGPPGLFTVLHGCLLRGNRVVVPLRLRSEVLARLHRVHQGIVRTKSLARSYVWNYKRGTPWLPGVVLEREGPRNFKITTPSCLIERRNLQQIRRRWHESQSPCVNPNVDLSPNANDLKNSDFRYNELERLAEAEVPQKTSELPLNDDLAAETIVSEELQPLPFQTPEKSALIDNARIPISVRYSAARGDCNYCVFPYSEPCATLTAGKGCVML
ncbi:hypothetical protein B566_EDAN017008 [Ephemera danica]|nr:hypothetical protein B566_EDAN017008 [Ephemera danica]